MPRRPPLYPRPAFKSSLGGLVMILERDKQTLHGAQRAERGEQDKRPPQHGVEPEWRLIQRLNHQGAPDHDESRSEDDKYRWPVAVVDEGVAEPAHLAVRGQARKSVNQLALAAAGRTAHKPGDKRGYRRVAALSRHASLDKTKRGGARRPPPEKIARN